MKKTTFLFYAFFLIIFTSCQKDEDNPSNIEGLSDNTVLIDSTDWHGNIINVDTTNYTFRFNKDILDTYDIKTGSIIVGTEDGGYLRKVKKIETTGNEVRILTEFAAITEAFEELHEQAEVPIIPNFESPEFWLSEGIEISNLKSTHANLINFNINAILYDYDGNFSTKIDQIRMSGNYDLNANFYIDFDIENAEISKLLLQYQIEQIKAINAYVGLVGIEYTYKKKLATIPCGTVAAGPVIIEPVIEIYAGFGVNMSAPLEMKFEQNYINTTTIKFENGNWDTQKEIYENEDFVRPTVSQVFNAKLYLKPILKFKIYRTVSPYIDAELFGSANAKLTSNILNWKASVGLDMKAGVSMMIWNLTVFDFNTNLFNLHHIIAEGQNYILENNPSHVTELIEANASKWFGGDDRINDQSQPMTRNVGTGQSICLDKDYRLNSFSAFFSDCFKKSDPDGWGGWSECEKVEILLQLRSKDGSILATSIATTENLPKFSSAWIDFQFDSPQILKANEVYVFTWYSKNAIIDNLRSGSNGNSENKYTGGSGLVGTIRPPLVDSDLNDWSNWGIHPWDFCFKLGGEFIN
jgi:hypothetical protein